MAAPTVDTIVTRPQRTYTVSAVDYISKWWSVHNPIYYNFTLGGDTISSIDNSVSGGIDIAYGDPTISDAYSVGDSVYINCGIYNGYFTIIAINAGAGITVDGAYIGAVGSPAATDTVINLSAKPNLKIEIEVYAKRPGSDDSVMQAAPVGTAKFSPRVTNNIFGTFAVNALRIDADISSFLQGCLQKCKDEIKYDLTFVNEIDENNYTFFFIKWRETYTGSGNTFTDDRADPGGTVYKDDNVFFATKSVRQLQRTNGSNLFEYVTFDAARVPQAKFISSFKRPKFYFGYPFDLTFIDSSFIYQNGPGTVTARFTPYKPDGTTYGGDEIQNLDAWQFPATQRLLFDLPWTDGDVWQLGVLGIEGSYIGVKIAIDTDVYIAEIQVDVINKCFNNPVYLKAKGDDGCWDYFMFEGIQDVSQETAGDGTFEPYVSDIGTADTNSDFISKSSRLSKVVGANGISSDDYNAYMSLARSPKVYMLTNSEYPWTWVTVKPRNCTTKRTTKNNVFDFEMIIDYPNQYKMSN